MTTSKIDLESAKFVVLDRPVCIWDPTLSETNRQFLRGLDPAFYVHQANLLQSGLSEHDARSIKNPNDRFSALALRIQFGMALESMFALLGAVIQAPDCVFGWLSVYQNSDLVGLVQRITDHGSLRTRKPFRPATWENISRLLLQPLAEESPDNHERLSRQFSDTWYHFARFYCDPIRAREYNCLKHSFRISPVGIKITFTHEDEEFFTSECAIGHRFPYLKKNPNRKFDYSISHASVALEPECYAAGMVIAALSINNAISFARTWTGDIESERKVLFPSNDGLFGIFTKMSAAIQSTSFGRTSTPDRYCSEEEIYADYDNE